MKALFCGYCFTIAGLPRDRSEVGCHCRATNGDLGARCRGRWVDPGRGIAIFTEVAQGGAERDDDAEMIEAPCRCCGKPGKPSALSPNFLECDDCLSGWSNPSPVYVPRGHSLPKVRALYVLGIHNAVLTYADHARLDHVRAAKASHGSLFADCESLVVRFRPGESSDTANVPLPFFLDGVFPDDEELTEAWSSYAAAWRPASKPGEGGDRG